MTPSDYLGGGGWKVDIRSQLNRCEGGEDGNGGWKGDGRVMEGGWWEVAQRGVFYHSCRSFFIPICDNAFSDGLVGAVGDFGVDGWFGGFSYSLPW